MLEILLLLNSLLPWIGAVIITILLLRRGKRHV